MCDEYKRTLIKNMFVNAQDISTRKDKKLVTGRLERSIVMDKQGDLCLKSLFSTTLDNIHSKINSKNPLYIFKQKDEENVVKC